jgi:hypothetical protein
VITLVFVWRVAAVAPHFQPAKPLRNGPSDTDKLTDQCIEQLWILSKQLQEDKIPEIFPSCPASGRSYLLVEEGEDTVIMCPSPEEHGFTRLSVSRKSPIPLVLSGGEQ